MHSKPVFADPSGRRQRLMRRAGLAVAAALGACLLAVVVSVAGGPQAPLTHWAAPRHVSSSPRAGAGMAGQPAGARTGTPSPSAQAPAGARAPNAHPASSPAATNPAGHTPSGLGKSPNPHKSTHGA